MEVVSELRVRAMMEKGGTRIAAMLIEKKRWSITGANLDHLRPHPRTSRRHSNGDMEGANTMATMRWTGRQPQTSRGRQRNARMNRQTQIALHIVPDTNAMDDTTEAARRIIAHAGAHPRHHPFASGSTVETAARNMLSPT